MTRGSKRINGKGNNAARPQSVYAKRDENDIVYTNKAFNEYFTQSLEVFAEKFPILKAKQKSYLNRVKSIISTIRCKSAKCDVKLQK